MYDIQEIRKDFPILGREVYGRPLVYLDNGATTQKPRCVVEAMTDEYYNVNANVHRGVHFLSQQATELHEAARETVRRFLNARSPAEIVFTRGTTESINLVASCFGEAFMREGDEVILSEMEHHSNIVSWQLLQARRGIKLRVVPINGRGELMLDEYERLFNDRTRIVSVTHVSNVLGTVNPVRRMIDIAHAHGVPLIVDNTFTTPINCRPFEWGADIVTHSTTKYMDGHAAAVGGAIVDSGNFDWEAHRDKFPGLTDPDPSYHGLSYSKSFGKGAYITKATVQLMRDLGSIQSPQNAFLLNLGLETLHLRVPRHCENAQKVAEWLEANPKVKWVNYCGLKSSKYYDLAQKYMPNGTCGVISFAVDGTKEDTVRFMDALRLAAIVTHVADARTCVLHPASHTHRQMNEQQLKEAGVDPGMIRLSVGIEDVADIIADLEQALKTL